MDDRAMILNSHRWPFGDVLCLKQRSPEGYKAFGVITTPVNPSLIHIYEHGSNKIIDSGNVEELLIRGWIVD